MLFLHVLPKASLFPIHGINCTNPPGQGQTPFACPASSFSAACVDFEATLTPRTKASGGRTWRLRVVLYDNVDNIPADPTYFLYRSGFRPKQNRIMVDSVDEDLIDSDS